MTPPETTAVHDLLEQAVDTGLGKQPAAPVESLVAAGRARARRRRWQAVAGAAVAAVVAAGAPVLLIDRHSPSSPQVAAGGGGGAGQGGWLQCGGIRVPVSALPGRPVGRTEHDGPAEGLDQVYRLYEWSRKTPYDTATWTVVEPSPGVALLVATAPGSRTYVPVHRQPDGHWLADQPCLA